ncbi:hypothetical protein [Niastella yeongjuensis]|uniref:hypothetical protein n=1 Tax=Niastella yeongjuensis TaxID=354355 RepID=UPI0008C1AF60|nr:hypothetical protein [Niastella yeongjuensis]SEP49215.1 hypothetical protein SAMN05660816_06912 [Niastella yeongjuensis]
MKALAFILIQFIIVGGCNSSRPKGKLIKNVKHEQKTIDKLFNCSERIVLLSTLKGISYDSLNHILTDYHLMTANNFSVDSSRYFSNKAIDDISEKYKISKRKIALLVFSFKYEMLTKEEIFEEELDKIEKEQDLEPPEDPY